MTTPAGLTRYSRVIRSKFAGTCLFCQVTTTATGDYAAVNAEGRWISCCQACSVSIASQAAGVIKSIETLADGHDVDGDAILMPTDENLLATLQGSASEALAYDTLVALIFARGMVVDAVKPAPARDETVEALRLIAADATASPRDRNFAESLVAGFERYGSLTMRQREAAVRMVTRGAGTAKAAPVENGLYLHDDGTIRKLYTTQNDRQGAKKLIVTETSHSPITGGYDGLGEAEVKRYNGSFEYITGGTKLVAEAVAAGTARLLTEAEAQAFGKLHGFCVDCARDLDDDRSLAVGYGPVCASNRRWFYPTKAEAAAMLNRPTTI